MNRHFVTRLAILQLLLLAMLVVLVGRLWQMQVARPAEPRETKYGSPERTIALPTARGRILDAKGRVLVGNTGTLVVLADRSALRRLSDDDRRAVFERLSELLDEPSDVLVGRTRLCGSAGAVRHTCWNGSPYEPVPLASDVSPEVALAVAERSEAFPGITVEPRTVRVVTGAEGANAAHVLGYVAPATERDLARPGVLPSDLVGRDGLERVYDQELRGTHGRRTVRVDAAGRVTEVVAESTSTRGADLVTSIDAELQALVERELRQAMKRARRRTDPVTGRRYEADSGAAVVLDARSGRIRALASLPTYDPDIWRNGPTREEASELFDDPERAPLLSRAIQGQYAPGSTFKIVPTAAAFEAGRKPSTVLPCPSAMKIGGRMFRNYRSIGYGPVSFRGALAVSCDTFFYRLAVDLWREPRTRDAVSAMARRFGFGRPTGVDLPGESSGRIGRHARYAGDAALRAIGQGDTTVTPLQLAVAYAAIANGGTVWEPRIGRAVLAPDGESVVRRIDPEVAGRLPLSRQRIGAIASALRETTRTGTAAIPFASFPLDRCPVAAKTGTAEVAGAQTTSWLATFDERHVVVMMITQAGTGSGASGTAVRRIWEDLCP